MLRGTTIGAGPGQQTIGLTDETVRSPLAGTKRNADASVLVVEDESLMQMFLGGGLSGSGYRVSTAGSLSEARALLARTLFDLLLLDLILPDGNGLDLMPDVPTDRTGVIVLTSMDNYEEKLKGLALGIDDFLTKPFSVEELLLRCRNLLRRLQGSQDGAERKKKNPRDVCRFRSWRFTPATRSLYAPDGREVTLTPIECQLLHALIDSAGRPLTRAELLDALDHPAEGRTERSIDWFVLKLRRKLGDDAKQPCLIGRQHGVGYRFLTAVSWE